MNGILLVARRELSIQLRSKGFLISVLATVIIVAAVVVVPTLVNRSDSYRVGLVGGASQALAEPLSALSDQAGIEMTIADPVDESAARAVLTDGELDAAVLDGQVVISESALDQQVSGLIQGANQAVQSSARLAASGLSADQIQDSMSVTPLKQLSISGEEITDGTRQGLAFLIMLCLLYLFMTTPVGVAAGVVEEKSSRIVEILLVAIRPWQLLTGKLFAFGVLGLIQLTTFAVTGIGAALAVDLTGSLPDDMVLIVAMTYLAYIFGFLFFGAMAAALGSLVSRQEETNGTLAPMTAAVVLSYLAAFIVSTEPDLPVSGILTVLPPISTISLPVQIAAGNATAMEIGIGVALMVGSIVAMVALGARIYERSVLRTGGRIRLTEAIKGGS
jgi:ABC-2 type transport system permease protein